MNITIYAKKRNTQEGKTFYSYLATLIRKDGTKQGVSVRFRDEAGNPKPEKCPMNIIVDKSAANLVIKQYTNDETGETGNSYTLWVSEWKQGEAFVDHSLDDFE